MQAHRHGKVEAVGHRANALDDLERPGESMGGSVQQAEQHPCSHVKLHLAMVLVVVPLGVLLRLEKTLVNLLQERVPIPQHGVHRLCLGCPLLVRKKGGWGAPVHHLERRCPERGVV